MISVDLTDLAKKHVYVTDEIPAGLVWSNYLNDSIDFTQSTWNVANNG